MLVCLVLIWSESFRPDSFFHDLVLLRSVLFWPLFYGFVILFESCLVKNFAFVHFCPSKSPVSRSGMDVMVVTVWTGLDIEFSAKLGSLK